RRFDPRGSDLDFGRDDPGDVGFAGSDLWSARWIGRVRLPAPRATIRVRSDDGHRLWVDGVFVGGGYDPEPMDESYPLSLAEGWHDVILELSEHSLDAFARLTLDDGTAFAPEDMRPRTRFGGDVFAKAATPQQSVGPGSTGSATLPLVLGGTAGPEAVELSAVITATAEPEGISLRIDAPDGREYLFDVDAIGRRVAGTDVWRMRRVLTGDGLPTAVAGGWRFTVQNTGDETVRFERAGVLAHVAADPSPYPVEGVYEAEPLDLGAPRTITGAFADVDLARDAEVVVAVRAAADAAALERATWVTADDAGALPMALRGSVVQLRLTLRGPGWETPRVRSVSVRGTSCP
ncbi:MAG TPA: hypothetical protein RMG45_10285, partial [Polyangiaceae bacterium LLY-WYZ-15_(1-7)]|nr:hypothetical protein [Polyangiaceae bacterium LLY-WYZ-15_(1-7)]